MRMPRAQDEFCCPSYVVGHSLGEFMAAVAAGVLDMPTAMMLVCERANLMSSIVSKGSMMAIKGSAELAAKAIEDASAVGKVSCVVLFQPTLLRRPRPLVEHRIVPSGRLAPPHCTAHASHRLNGAFYR